MSFRSAAPLWLASIVPLLLWLFVARERHRTAIARRFASERLRGVFNPARGVRPWLLSLALTAALLALAGPLAGYRLTPIVALESNRIIVIDVSHSMAAEDVGTSRLAAAKAIAARLVEAHQGRTAVVVFEGVPEVVAPLTSDSDAVISLVETLQPGEVGEPGSDLGGAVLAALRLLEGDPGRSADIVVISDGEDQRGRVAEAAKRARARSISVSSLLIGTVTGGNIPTGRGPLRDDSGEVVTTRAHPEELERLAKETGGVKLDNPFAADALAPLSRRQRAGTPRQTHARTPIDRYQWPLSFALIAFLGASFLHRGAE